MKKWLFMMLFSLIGIPAYCDDINWTDPLWFLQSTDFRAHKLDYRSLNYGRWVFLGVDGRDSPYAGEWRPLKVIKYDAKQNIFSIVISDNVITPLFARYQLENMFNISSDFKLNRIVFNTLRPALTPITDWAAPFGSELIVFDVKQQKPILRKFEGRFYSEVTMSYDGRYVAYLSHDTEYLVKWPNKFDYPDYYMNRTEILDIETSKTTVIAPEIKYDLRNAELQWTEDSKDLIFIHSKIEDNREIPAVFKWSVKDGSMKTFPLTPDRLPIEYFRVMKNNKIVLATAKEIFVLNSDLTFNRTIDKNPELFSIHSDGVSLKFNASMGNKILKIE